MTRCLAVAVLLLTNAQLPADEKIVAVETPLAPPNWALQERALLKANAAACKEFFAHYFDSRGYLECVERWGGDDGPDDAIENLYDWPILHALGGSDDVLTMYKKAWEGHLRQYTEAKTVEVPFAREGMYFKEFPVTFDWLHNGEGLCVFNLQGLSDPYDTKFGQRVRRYAGFYLNDDAGAPNYDPKHKIIRSLFNGSRGPLLRKATALDWAGDPIVVEGRFQPGHGERNYREMLEHFKDYNDIVGDHPQNLLTTTLAANAYLLTHEERYKKWLLEYVDAWRERMAANGNVIPSNIGLDGTIGGETGGKWYGGVYGWGFTVAVPGSKAVAHRNTHQLGFVGFMNAYLLTGDDHYLDAWRKQIDAVNAQKKVIGGKPMYPRMCGDKGWYHFLPEPYNANAMEIYYLSMKREDLARCPDSVRGASFEGGTVDPSQIHRTPNTGWFAFLAGKDKAYPEEALRADFTRVRSKVAGMRKDPSTPDTRLADDPAPYNPASVTSLIELMLGGLAPGRKGALLHCRLRYFDPEKRRAGVPDDVAALVDKMTGDEVAVTLVNTNQVEPRTVVVQAGGYAEHQFLRVTSPRGVEPVNAAHLTVRLAPGCGERLVFTMKRFANAPTLAFPWDRGWVLKKAG